MTVSQNLLYMMAFFIPFASLGPTISGFVISPSFLFGLLFGCLVFKFRSVSSIQVALALLFIGFSLTAVGRHNPESYIPSLLALAASIFPISRPLDGLSHYRAFSRGFKLGLVFTLAFVALEIASQLAGLSSVYNSMTGIVRDSETIVRQHNFFIAYYRPYGLMSEPAHLALYLVSAFVFLHISGSSALLQGLTLLGVILTGSVSGILLLVIYFAACMFHLTSLRNAFNYRQILRVSIVALVFTVFLISFWSTISDTFTYLLDRVSVAFRAIQTGELVGSEESRANAFIALPKYWDQKGILGILFGTGYSNYAEWASTNFGSLGLWSALARGDVNNMLVAVMLSTGLLGTLLFFNLLRAIIQSNDVRILSSIGLFALSFQFFYGAMVSYFYWYVLFAIVSAHKFKHLEN